MSDLRFGLSLERTESVAALPPLPPEFSMLKLPVAALESAAVGRRLRALGAPELLVDEIADRTLCRLAPEAGMRLQLEFSMQFARRCRRAAAAGARMVAAPFDLERATGDSEFRTRLLALLRGLGGVLDDCGLRLLLPLRLPLAPEGTAIGAYGEWMRELPGACFGLSAELHPHEPAFARWERETLRPVRFETAALEVVYEPGIGNRLTDRLLQEVLEAVDRYDRPVRMWFRPVGVADDALEAEIADLARLTGLLRRKGGEAC